MTAGAGGEEDEEVIVDTSRFTEVLVCLTFSHGLFHKSQNSTGFLFCFFLFSRETSVLPFMAEERERNKGSDCEAS